jgi:AcrR family transcriptional regulator
MARRADHSKEELMEMMIVAARDIIATEGVEALSARSLSRRIGYTPGTLYNHFKNLDDIVTAVNSRTLRSVGEAFARIKPDADGRRRLHAYGDAFLDYLAANGRLWNALFEFKREPGVPMPAWYIDNIGALVAIVAQCFVAMRPKVSQAEAEKAAKLVFASIHSVSSLRNSGRLELVMDRDIGPVVHELIDIHVTAFMHG